MLYQSDTDFITIYSVWYEYIPHMDSKCFYKQTCSVQLTLFFRNSTNLSTTPGVFMTSSIGGLGSEVNSNWTGCEYVGLVCNHGNIWKVRVYCLSVPLESSFLNFCVVVSWSSGSSEKSISTMSLVMTPSYNDDTTHILNTWSAQQIPPFWRGKITMTNKTKMWCKIPLQWGSVWASLCLALESRDNKHSLLLESSGRSPPVGSRT